MVKYIVKIFWIIPGSISYITDVVMQSLNILSIFYANAVLRRMMFTLPHRFSFVTNSNANSDIGFILHYYCLCYRKQIRIQIFPKVIIFFAPISLVFFILIIVSFAIKAQKGYLILYAYALELLVRDVIVTIRFLARDNVIRSR
jgi:hypothetical protein